MSAKNSKIPTGLYLNRNSASIIKGSNFTLQNISAKIPLHTKRHLSKDKLFGDNSHQKVKSDAYSKYVPQTERGPH